MFLGGVVGTALRLTTSLLVPTVDRVPLPTLIVNVSGALVLGFLLTWLAQRGPDEGASRAVRMLVGTGVIGSYTTYSALATDSAVLLESGHAATSALYVGASLVAGLIAAGIGAWLASLCAQGSRGTQEDEA